MIQIDSKHPIWSQPGEARSLAAGDPKSSHPKCALGKLREYLSLPAKVLPVPGLAIIDELNDIDCKWDKFNQCYMADQESHSHAIMKMFQLLEASGEFKIV